MEKYFPEYLHQEEGLGWQLVLYNQDLDICLLDRKNYPLADACKMLEADGWIIHEPFLCAVVHGYTHQIMIVKSIVSSE